MQPQIAAQQQQQADRDRMAMNEIAQYVGAKWGRPAVLVLFQGPGAATFQTLTLNEPGEGQFTVAGAELQAMGRRIQSARLDTQFKVTVQQR